MTIYRSEIPANVVEGPNRESWRSAETISTSSDDFLDDVSRNARRLTRIVLSMSDGHEITYRIEHNHP